MKVLVTGAHGKVGRALVPALMRAGHDVRASDLTRPAWDRLEDPREAEDYWQVDLTDAGAADALARGCDAVVHTAAIPQPIHNAPHVVFDNNLMSTFNLLEAAISAGAGRFVNFSSETVPGFIFAHRPYEPDYLPIDEEHPVRPQDSYATAKWFGELLMERAPERADIATISIRPCWVQDVASYERNLGPIVRDPSVLVGNFCSYVDVYDLCEATPPRGRVRPPGSRGPVRRLAGHDRRAPARGDRAASPWRDAGGAAAAAAAGRLRDRLLEGAPAARLGADTHVAGLPRRRRQAEGGRGGAVVTRRLGSAGPEITTLGFGTWALAGRYRFGWGPVDDEESVAAIRRAVEAGVSWIDTAPTYADGHSEEVVGRAIEPFRAGEEVLVFTKCGRPWRGGEVYFDLRPDSIRQECEASLRRLGVERIDLYQFHWPDYATGTPVEESWGTMVELVDEGKVRWLGVCNFDVPRLRQCEAIRHVDSLQPPLSLLNRHARRELLPWARENGTGLIAYSPMASGLLTGSFNREGLTRLAEDDWRRRAPAFQEPQLARNLALVGRLEPLAARLGVSVSALAVAWVLAQPGVTGAIVGGRRPSQLDDWLGGGDLQLDEQLLGEVEALLEETGAGTDEAPQPPVV